MNLLPIDDTEDLNEGKKKDYSWPLVYNGED